MKRIGSILLLMVMLTASGCFHTTVVTGRPESTKVVDRPWHPFVIYGLVPIGGDLDVSDACPNGVAKVETEISFMNGLVSAITFSIFTPAHVKVTCAS